MNIVALAERQARKWRLAGAQRAESKTTIHPVVVVSRQHGTNGARLGQSIANQLGYEFWGQRLLHEMAEHGQLSEVLLSSLDERPKNIFIEAFAANKHICTTTSEYMRELLFQLHLIGHHGNAVVLGRGAQFALETGRTFRVRLVAPREYRSKQIAARDGMEDKEARAEVDRVDAERAKFIHEQWSQSIDDIYAYDLLVNAEHLSTDSAADGIVAAYKGRFNLSF